MGPILVILVHSVFFFPPLFNTTIKHGANHDDGENWTVIILFSFKNSAWLWESGVL